MQTDVDNFTQSHPLSITCEAFGIFFVVDYIIIKPIQGYTCDMKASYAKYWKPRTTLDVGHRGAGNSTTTAK